MSSKTENLSRWFQAHSLIVSTTQILVLCATILGCQGKKSKPVEIGDSVLYTAAEVTDFDNTLSKSKLTCADPVDCPENVAMLSFVVKNRSTQKEELAQCTGTLIAPRILMTNSHCLSEKIKRSPERCALFGATFRLKSGELVRRKCHRVLQQTNATADAAQTPDIAIIELKEDVPVTPATLSRAGVVEAKPYFFYAVNPILPDPNSKDVFSQGVIAKKTGTSSYSSLITPFYNNRLSHVVNFFIDKDILVGGNSGSSLRNEAGEVIGVMQATLENPQQAEQLKLSPGFSLATNIACLDLATVQLPKHPLCAKTESQIPKISFRTPKAEDVLVHFTNKLNRRRVLGYNLAYEVKSQPEISDDPKFDSNTVDLNYSIEFRTFESCMTRTQELKPGSSYPALVLNGVTAVNLNDRWVPSIPPDNAVLSVDQLTPQVRENAQSGVLQTSESKTAIQLCGSDKDFIKKDLLIKAMGQ